MPKIVAISDTHLDHPNMENYWGDIIIHCGDVTCRGYENELQSFVKWFSSLNQFKHKIMIPGNHDFIFENEWEKAKQMCDNAEIICLNDSGSEIEGINIWGSPITPWFHSWAFNRHRGAEIQKHWEMIPKNTNILITHGPPSNIGSLSKVRYEDVGCEDLRQKVDEIKPKYHLFGHIHEGYGMYQNTYTTFINCAHLNRSYLPSNPPVEFFYDPLACN